MIRSSIRRRPHPASDVKLTVVAEELREPTANLVIRSSIRRRPRPASDVKITVVAEELREPTNLDSA